MELTSQQQSFFDTFGYLVFRGLVADEIETINAEFRAVFDDKGIIHDTNQRTCVVPFIDQREKLCALLDHPGIHAVAEGILGKDFNYVGSDGNYYTGDTGWHRDGSYDAGRYIKIAFYLDPVGHDSGALRVIPGSHRLEMKEWPALKARNAQQLWDIEQSQVPCATLKSRPGDVVAFHHNLMHCSFGGSSQRRMFTMNLCKKAETPQEIADFEHYINDHARFWIDRLHGDIMIKSANEKRQRHLQQVWKHEDHLSVLAAKARQEMAEPARG